jgi:hypothetical protein
MRRKTAASEATFFVFLFHLFTTNITRASLETIKGEAGATSKRELTSTRRNNTHTPPLRRDLGFAPSLEKLVTPTTSTPV